MAVQCDVVSIRKKLDILSDSDVMNDAYAEELLQALSKIPMTVDVLKESKIALTLNRYRKNYKGKKIGALAQELRRGWMKIWESDAVSKKKGARVISSPDPQNAPDHDLSLRESGGSSPLTAVICNDQGVIAIFKAMMCLTQRVRFDVTVRTDNLELTGKSFQCVIPLSTIQNIFLLPDSNNTQCYFMIELNDPVRRGKTDYKMFVFTLSKKISLTHELLMNQMELDMRYSGRLRRHMIGLENEVVSTIFEVVTDKKLITADSSKIGAKNHYISCSCKSDSGLLYPLENSFVFLPKPSLHIKFEDIHSVEFGRGDEYNRSFDLVINTSSRKLIHFSIEKGKYDFIQSFLINKELISPSK